MNAIVPFAFEDSLVRALWVEEDPWFVLADVCRVLEHSNPSAAAGRLDDDEKMTLSNNEGHSGKRGGAQSFICVSESGLYALVMTSRKPQAKRFRKWVTAEVLPTLRKTGRYQMGPDATQDPEGEWSKTCWERQDVNSMVSMVRECKNLWGKAAARELWQSLPLPQPACYGKSSDSQPRPEEMWWKGRLAAGEQIPGSGEWAHKVNTADLLHAYFIDQGKELYGSRRASDPRFGKVLQDMVPGLRRGRRTSGSHSRPWIYIFPPLDACRKAMYDAI